MARLLDYVREKGNIAFTEEAFNHIDQLILTELTYLDWEGIVPFDFDYDEAISLREAIFSYQNSNGTALPLVSLVKKDRLSLMNLVGDAKRYQQILAFGFVNDTKLETTKQFAAVTFSLHDNTKIVVFRGTDAQVVSWKEDFNMTYMVEIPAQKSAREYLEKVMETIPGNYRVTGHSKGGSLALYASSQLTSCVQNRLIEAVTFDAPGLHRLIKEASGYLQIANRITAYIPQSSLVGMMLEIPEKVIVVKSQTAGLLQHFVFSWELEGTTFQGTELSQVSIDIDKVLKEWTNQLSDAELQLFFDSLFDVFLNAGINQISDLSVNNLKKVKQLLANIHSLPRENKKHILSATQLLIALNLQVMKASFDKKMTEKLSKGPLILNQKDKKE